VWEYPIELTNLGFALSKQDLPIQCASSPVSAV